jgi:hypothetical protein
VAIALHVDSAPANKVLFNQVTWSYGYEACAGDPLLSEKLSRSTVVNYEDPSTGGAGGASGGTGGVAGTGGAGGDAGVGPGGAGGAAAGGAGGAAAGGAGGADGGGGSGGANGGSQDTGGCGCRTAGERGTDALWPLAAIGLLSARRRARRLALRQRPAGRAA